MTKKDILHHFQDINFYYNDCMMYADLSGMLDELIAENKGLTAEQSLHILDSIELNVDKILDDILELREQLWDIEYTDDSCDKYYEEDVYTAYNCIANRIKRSVKNIDVIIRSAKDDMREKEVANDT